MDMRSFLLFVEFIGIPLEVFAAVPVVDVFVGRGTVLFRVRPMSGRQLCRFIPFGAIDAPVIAGLALVNGSRFRHDGHAPFFRSVHSLPRSSVGIRRSFDQTGAPMRICMTFPSLL